MGKKSAKQLSQWLSGRWFLPKMSIWKLTPPKLSMTAYPGKVCKLFGDKHTSVCISSGFHHFWINPPNVCPIITHCTSIPNNMLGIFLSTWDTTAKKRIIFLPFTLLDKRDNNLSEFDSVFILSTLSDDKSERESSGHCDPETWLACLPCS